MLFNVSVKHSKSTSARLVIATFLFYVLIGSTLYQGLLIKNLNASEKLGAITTIRELLNLNYKLVVTPSMITVFLLQKEFDKERGDVHYRALKYKEGVSTEEGLKDLLANKDVGFLWAGRYTGSYLNRFYDPITGENLLEVIPRSLFEFYVASMAPKASPFIDKFNDIILRIIESGLHVHQMNQAYMDNDKIWYQRLRNGLTPKPPSLSLTMRDTLNIFKMYMLLITSCFLAFVGELLMNHFKYCFAKK